MNNDDGADEELWRIVLQQKLSAATMRPLRSPADARVIGTEERNWPGQSWQCSRPTSTVSCSTRIATCQELFGAVRFEQFSSLNCLFHDQSPDGLERCWIQPSWRSVGLLTASSHHLFSHRIATSLVRRVTIGIMGSVEYERSNPMQLLPKTLEPLLNRAVQDESEGGR